MTLKVLFITNLCPEYRVRPFELLAKRHQVTFCFYSAGDEPYWDRRRPEGHPRVKQVHLKGLSPLPRVRVTPGLIPLVLRHDWDVIIKCINGRFALPATYVLAKLKKVPFVLWTETWKWPTSLVHWLARPLVRRAYLGADAICVSGDHVLAFLQLEGADPERVHLVPQNVDPYTYGREVGHAEKQSFRLAQGIHDEPVVLFVGRLVAEKGLADLLSAFRVVAAAHPATLVIAGEGPLRKSLELEAQEKMPGRVRFLGHIGSCDLPVVYGVAACLVLPSRTTPMFREPWGLVVNEAFHQGVPVVVSDSVGAAAGGLVQDGRTGFVVPEGDVEVLADRIDRILTDRTLREGLSMSALEAVRAWSPEAMADGFCRAIEQVTGRRAAERVA